jgi:hypothetical protein
MRFNKLMTMIVIVGLAVSGLANASLLYVANFEFEDTVGGDTNGPITGQIFGTVDSDMLLTVTRAYLTGVGEHPALSEMHRTDANTCGSNYGVSLCGPVFDLSGDNVLIIPSSLYMSFFDPSIPAYPAQTTVASLRFHRDGTARYKSYQNLTDTHTRSRYNSDGTCNDSRHGCVTERITTGTLLHGLSFTEVPEPSSLAIFALSIMGLGLRRFKKQS